MSKHRFCVYQVKSQELLTFEVLITARTMISMPSILQFSKTLRNQKPIVERESVFFQIVECEHREGGKVGSEVVEVLG